MDVLALHDLEATIRRDIPEFQVGFKDESRIMKLLGFLANPINPGFMTRFTTTWGTTVYFPTREYYETKASVSFEILAHEYVHLWDKKQSQLFTLSYVFPQVLAIAGLLTFGALAWPYSWLLLLPVVGYLFAAWISQKSSAGFVVALGLMLLATFGLSIWLTGWVTAALGIGLLGFGPWPAPWRTKWELRGYTMSVAVALWLGTPYTPTLRDAYVQYFVGSGYYFMSWSRPSIEKAFDDVATQVASGALQGRSRPYEAVYDFLYQRGLLHR
jgi:hypothetical protein